MKLKTIPYVNTEWECNFENLLLVELLMHVEVSENFTGI